MMTNDSSIVLYVIRHGTTVMNRENVFRGDADPPLDTKGRQDAHLLASFFEPIEVFPLVVSSDKKRATQTASIIADRKSIAVHSHADLRPWNIGDFGGLPKDDKTRAELEKYVQNPDMPTPNGESLSAARGRVVPLIQEAIRTADECGQPMMVVVHSSVMHMIGEAFGNHHEDAHVKPGGVAAIYWNGERLDVEPIFKPDERSQSQNVLGTKKSSMNS